MAPTKVTYSPEYLAESKATLLNTLYAIPIFLEIASTVLRLWVKPRPPAGARLAFDDYLMIWATVVAVAECVTGLIYGAPYGLGRHKAAVSPYELEMFLMGDYIFSHFYNVAIGSTKLSVLALYYRIFATRNFRMLVVATIIFVCAWLFVMEIVLGFGCQPIQAWWGVGKGHCVNKVSFTYFTNVTNLASDLWIFTMPIPIILGLQATMDRRISLCFLFSIGLGTCAISAARLSFVFGVGSPDMTWYVADLGILSAWEPCGGILCANLPLVYRAGVQVITHFRSRMRGSLRGHRDEHGSPQHPKIGMYHDWTRLNNSGGLTGERNHTVTEVCATKKHHIVTEMDALRPDGIMVKREIRQDGYLG